uniref:Endonuclease/exonuclease/phosphatase domain-containing protein n=1 Tax=Micrurus spixii TaxID=129469 RepID=A0A2D4M1Y7_9SAUR
MNLKDAWRELNTPKSQFIFFSNPHQSWSRIDMIWMDSELLEKTEAVEILPNTWADHNPIKLTWRGKKKLCRWTFNKSILRDKEYTQMINKELKIFLEINTNEYTTTQNLWDTTKAYVRGLTIAYVAKKNRDRKNQQIVRKRKLEKLEIYLQKDPRNELVKKQLNLAKHEINLSLQEEMARKLKLAKQYYFENANKPGSPTN